MVLGSYVVTAVPCASVTAIVTPVPVLDPWPGTDTQLVAPAGEGADG